MIFPFLLGTVAGFVAGYGVGRHSGWLVVAGSILFVAALVWLAIESLRYR